MGWVELRIPGVLGGTRCRLVPNSLNILTLSDREIFQIYIGRLAVRGKAKRGSRFLFISF